MEYNLGLFLNSSLITRKSCLKFVHNFLSPKQWWVFCNNVEANLLSPAQSLKLKLHRCVNKTTHKRSTKVQVLKWNNRQVLHNNKTLDCYKKLSLFVVVVVVHHVRSLSTGNKKLLHCT